MRPEHLADATLIDGYQRIRALIFEVKVDLVESLGADKYVYFTTSGPVVHAAQLDELEAEGEVRENQFVARVSAESKAAIGQSVELAFDTTKLAVFDADSGVNLTFRRPPRVILDQVRAHLRGHFAGAEPDSASVTFLGAEPIEVLRFARPTVGALRVAGLLAAPDDRPD